MNDADLARLRDALSANRDEFVALAEAMSELVWIADASGTILYFNRPWIAYTGTDVDTVRGSLPQGVVHPEDVERMWEAWNHALHCKEPFEIEYRLRRADDGTYRWFVARAIAIVEGREVIRWIGTVTDIDAQRRTSDNLRFAVEAGSELHTQLDADSVCARLVQLAVHAIADSCVVILEEQPQRYRTAAIAHRDPARAPDVDRFRERYPLREQPEIVEDAMLRDLHISSAMIVPLASVGRTRGAIMFFSMHSGRRYERGDLEVAQMVTRQAAGALESTHIFEEQRRRSHRLRFVSQASEMLFESFDISNTWQPLAEYAATEIADVTFVIRRGEDGGLRTVAAAANTPSRSHHVRFLVGERARPEAEPFLIERLSSGRAYLNPAYDIERESVQLWEYLVAHVRALNITSLIVVPLLLHGQVYGSILFGTCDETPRFDERDLSAISELGRRASIAIGQSETFARERRIATELQRALLPEAGMLPDGPAIHFSPHYRPASNEADIGGDWYDALELADGSIVVSVGDVTGRGLFAAGLMGKLRQALAVVSLYETDPARMLDAVDLILRSRGAQQIATAFVGIIDPQRRSIRFANAGHPYPLLKRSNETVALEAEGLPLGLRDRESASVTREMSLVDARLLVLFTDGLVESTRNILEGERQLRAVLSSDAVLYTRNPSLLICEACIASGAHDDAAILAVRFGTQHAWSFDAENAKAASDARGEFMEYLRRHAVAGDMMAAEVIFGELIGNVVRHAPGPIEVQIEWGDAHPTLHVIDRGSGFNRRPELPSDPLTESGRGLYIIEALSRLLHVEYLAHYGTHISVELPVSRDPDRPASS